MFEDDQYPDCDTCQDAIENDDPDNPPFMHCCGCGADGSSERPDCVCD